MTFVKRVSIASCAAALLASVGCSGSSSGPATVAELPPVLAQSLCDKFDQCLGAAAPFLFGASGSDCVTLFTQQITDQQVPLWQAGIDSNTLSYDSSRVNACRDALASADCSALGATLPAACDAVFSGTIAAGAACHINEECAGDAYCDQSSACPGACSARVAAGDACTSDEACQLGLVCNDGACSAAIAVGAACEGPSGPHCGGLLTCAGATDTASGTCTMLRYTFSVARGDPCDAQTSMLCASGSFCAVTGVAGGSVIWTCEAAVSSGASCHLAFPDECPASEYCDANPEMTGSFEGNCQPLPAAGEACITGPTGGTGKACAPGLQCLGEVCGVRGRLGAACTDGDGCVSELCNDGVCSAPSCG